MAQYQIPEVSGKIVAEVAKVLSKSSKALSINEVARSFESGFEGGFSPEYIRRALIACHQLKIAIFSSGVYSCNENDRDDLQKARKSELYIPFKKRLQDFAPFLLYVDYLSKEYTSMESATRIRGILDIDTSPEKIEKTFKNWGKFSKIIEEEKGEKLKISIETDKLLTDYVTKLIDALDAEIKAKVFTIDMLGPETFAYLDSQGIGLTELAYALRNYETDPKHSASRSCEVFENFMYSLVKTKAITLSKTRPTLMDYCDGLRGNGDLALNLLHVCHGMVGIRNMTHHSPDSETGKSWNISKQAALTSTLLVPILIRSVYQFANLKNQEM